MSHNYYPDKPDMPDSFASLVTPDSFATPDSVAGFARPDSFASFAAPDYVDRPDNSDRPNIPDSRPDWLDTPEAPLTPNTILQDRYRIVRQLGRGGMGAVYEAVDQRLGKTLAIKETLSSEASMRKQFEREARLLAVMHHPALPKVTDHFVEGNRAFLVMEFIGGHDLARIIAQQPGPFPREQVIAWADQLLDALIYLHTRDRQVIHRDIKPHNLKLTATGQIALLDFGLAKSQPSDPSVTSSQAFFGYTRHYAPLEQIQDQRTDPRSDIYALGATLYHLLTGIKPPDAMVRAAAVVNAGNDPLLPANEIHPAVGPQIAAILSKAMAQKPEDRYPDAHEFREALRRMGRTSAVGVERGVEKAGDEPRINAEARESELPPAEVGAPGRANVSKESPASDEPPASEPPAYAGGSDRRVAYAGGSDKPVTNTGRTDKRVANASGTDIFVEPPDMQMALVGSARRFGPAGVTMVLALIFAIAGGILYGAQRFFPLTETAADALSATPNSAAALRTSTSSPNSPSSRRQDRARLADSGVLTNTRTASVTDEPVERDAENADVNKVSGAAKSQSDKKAAELTKSQPEKRTAAVAKPSISRDGQESPRTTPRKEPHRVGAPSIRFPKVDFRDEPRDNHTTPAPQPRLHSEGPLSMAPKATPSGGGPKFYRAADGTQIVKFPDGSTQFIRPGQGSAVNR